MSINYISWNGTERKIGMGKWNFWNGLMSLDSIFQSDGLITNENKIIESLLKSLKILNDILITSHYISNYKLIFVFFYPVVDVLLCVMSAVWGRFAIHDLIWGIANTFFFRACKFGRPSNNSTFILNAR